jgi:hypothetical protein
MIDIIRDIEISGVDDALNILKSIDTDDNLFEKAHNVGDLFFRDGKTYIYTEYAPGKYDWHLVKTKKVIRGKGINGKHGLSALKSVYSGLDKTFNDPEKMMLKRTPNGHWRLFYDDADAGTTIGGDTITESELKEDNVCYQDKRVVDNFELLKGYMEFNNPDDVYFVQIIKRWKDNKDKPDADAWRTAGRKKGSYHSGGEFLNYYLIHSNSELDSLKSEIIKACSYNNARAYISINSRSQNAVNAYMSKFKSRFTDPNDPRVKNAEAILYGQAKSGPAWKNERFKVLLDIDTTRDATAKMPNGKVVNIWDETKKRLKDFNIKVAAEYETPSGGLHLILNNKNNRNCRPFYKGLKDFDGGRDLDRLATVHPSEDIKMVLYSNVDTAGY